MGIVSEGDVCQALSTQVLPSCCQFHCHPALSAGLGSLMIHSQFSHTNSLPSGMSVGGEGAGCQPSVPSVSVLGIDPFFVQYCIINPSSCYDVLTRLMSHYRRNALASRGVSHAGE
jgi:hypothetical protein